MKINVIGLYPIKESMEPCHLVEIFIEDFVGNIHLSEFTQEIVGVSRNNWQSPWNEYVLASDGKDGEVAPFPGPIKVKGSQRLAFFFHYLDVTRPLLTPWGFVSLPDSAPLPERLAFVKCEAPD